MQHPSPYLHRPLAAFAALLSLSTLAGAQTYTAKAGDSVAGNGDQQIASNPAVAFWDGTWTHSVRHAWARAEQGALETQALCTTDAKYNMAAYAIAEFKYDDVIFSSPNTGSIQVGLKLLIEGNSSVVNGNGFYVLLQHGNHAMGEAWRSADGNITATYDLAGWNMSDIFPFEHAITVPLNTPVSLNIRMVASASAVKGGHAADGQYTLRLGGPTPLPAPGKRYEVFTLPAGVTVNSVQGGISDNVWTESEELHLSADTALVAPGGSLQLIPWNGVPGQPVGLSIGWGPAPPPPALNPSVWSGFVGTLDGNGWWWADPIPNSAELAGATLLVQALSLDSSGSRVHSPVVEVQFQ